MYEVFTKCKRCNIHWNNLIYDERIFIYEVTFVKIFTAWEKFLEDSFISYLQGRSTKQLRPILITKKMGREKAYNLLKGTKKYPDWTKIDEVILLASIFFIRSNPYNLILSANAKELSHMKIIRNAITHISKNSIDGFKKLIRSELSGYKIDMSPGEFLMQNKLPSEQYLSYYINLLENAAKVIVQI